MGPSSGAEASSPSAALNGASHCSRSASVSVTNPTGFGSADGTADDADDADPSWSVSCGIGVICGLVGGGGIGTMLIQYQGQAMWNEVGTLIMLIAAVVWLMDTSSAYIREAIK